MNKDKKFIIVIAIMTIVMFSCSFIIAKTISKLEVKPIILVNYPTTEEVVETTEETTDSFVDIGQFSITGYTPNCLHCCGKSDGITASMVKAEVGKTVAMNYSDMKKYGIVYGDSIYIDGIGERIVEDTGCNEGVIDVACQSHDDCYKITGTYNVSMRR